MNVAAFAPYIYRVQYNNRISFIQKVACYRSLICIKVPMLRFFSNKICSITLLRYGLEASL